MNRTDKNQPWLYVKHYYESVQFELFTLKFL